MKKIMTRLLIVLTFGAVLYSQQTFEYEGPPDDTYWGNAMLGRGAPPTAVAGAATQTNAARQAVRSMNPTSATTPPGFVLSFCKNHK